MARRDKSYGYQDFGMLNYEIRLWDMIESETPPNKQLFSLVNFFSTLPTLRSVDISGLL